VNKINRFCNNKLNFWIFFNGYLGVFCENLEDIPEQIREIYKLNKG
jgi:hypothetical protein